MPNEAERLYRTLFGAAVPPVIAERFARAGALLDRNAAAPERAAYAAALASGLDLEALELAGRYTRRLPLLSRKLQLMAYLAETLPANQDRFINRRGGGFIPGAVQVGAAVARTVVKMAVGLWLLPRVRP